MCYNLLNFPQGGILNRQDTLKKIIDFEQPDLLLIQELKTSTGLDAIWGAGGIKIDHVPDFACPGVDCPRHMGAKPRLAKPQSLLQPKL